MVRVGNGYDVHQLTEGRRLVLCGVEIPYEKGLLGHSDADVAAHAVIDALLGAAGLDDIGTHFPDTDPAYRGADSMKLLEQTAALLAQDGWQAVNVDVIIVAQRPKLAPYFQQMKQNLAGAMGVDPGQVNIKAKTEEHMGFTGQGQGMKSYAVALIEKK